MKFPLIPIDNLSLKIVSVVMASLLWLYVMAGKDIEKRVQVPVILKNLDDSLTIIDKPPVSIDIELRGNRLSMLTMSKDSIKLILDMEGVKEGTVLFSNLEKTLISDNRVRVFRIFPSKIEMTLARIDNKNSAR